MPRRAGRLSPPRAFIKVEWGGGPAATVSQGRQSTRVALMDWLVKGCFTADEAGQRG